MNFLFVWTLLFSTFPKIYLCCNHYDDCFCDFQNLTEDTFYIQCSINENDSISVEIDQKEEKAEIDCEPNMTKFHFEIPPNCKIDEINFLKIYNCPWPSQSFDKILQKFPLQQIKVLEFLNHNKTAVNIDSTFFQKFDSLQELMLNVINITIINETSVFQHIPSLSSLELNANNLILTVNLFQYIPQLRLLDLSGNNLKNLPMELFQFLQNLHYLYLDNNHLKKLYDHIFHGLINLKSLELTRNQIEHISKKAFFDLQNLEEINLSSNKLKIISPNLFIKNRKLKLVRMRYNIHLQLSDYLFTNFSHLTNVDLTGCYLKTIPENIFKNSKNLKVIQLQKNRLKELPKNLFYDLINLEELRLEYNMISNLSNVFKGLFKLERLYLQNNSLKSLHFEYFSDLKNLKKINFNKNKIDVINPGIFCNNHNLNIINLAYNQIEKPVEEIIDLDTHKNIEVINLSHNCIKKLKLRNIQTSTNITLNLSNNNITLVDFEDIDLKSNDTNKIRIFLKHNPINCNYENYDLRNYFNNLKRDRLKFRIFPKQLNCANPLELKHKSIAALPLHTTFKFEEISQSHQNCPKKCLCEWRPLDKSIVINCSNQHLKDYPKINLTGFNFIKYTQIELNLEKNDLIRGPEEHFSNYKNITKLFLGHNHIKDITWLPPQLQLLMLNDNNLVVLRSEIVAALVNSKYLSKLVLDNNPWKCDCSFQILANFLRQQSNNLIEKPNLFCLNKNASLVVLTEAELCNNSYLITLWILSVVLPILILTMLCMFYYCFQQEIKIWLFSKNLFLRCITEEELDNRKLYDAFISYSHKDEEFVVENLLSELESGPNPYKLCLHFRYWVPGEFIATQITKSVLDSRRTVVVLSQNFLNSIWGKIEFRTAHIQAMREGRTRVIIILYEDIEMEQLDEELKLYFKTNTYLKWGDPYFWYKLRDALPHRRMAQN